MQIDGQIIMFWILFLLCSTISTLHLYKNFKILIASQTFVLQFAALLDISLINQQISPNVSLIIVLAVISLIGILHILILKYFGADLLLIITIILNLVVHEFWLAYPEITGGSGGLLINTNTSYQNEILLLLLCFFLFILYLIKIQKKEPESTWSFAKKLKFNAASYGIPIKKYYIFGFLFFSIIHAVIGISSVRYLGYLSIETFNLNWTLVVLSIVVFSKKEGYFFATLLSILYIFIKLVLRNLPNMSVTWANFLEISFPALLIILYIIRKKKYE